MDRLKVSTCAAFMAALLYGNPAHAQYAISPGPASANNLGLVQPDNTTLSTTAAGVEAIKNTYVGQSSITTLGTITTGTWQATKVGLAYGGTNLDMTATGGANQFLKQTSAGGALTVAAVTTSDLGTTLTPQFARMGLGAAADANHLIEAQLGSITTDKRLLDGSATWNAVGTTFYGELLNVTNTASAAGSRLLSLQVGGTPKFDVDTGGTVQTGVWNAGAVTATVAGATGLKALSGAAGSNTDISVGRTATEGQMAVAGGPDQYVSGSVAGDIIVRSSGATNLYLGTNAIKAIKIDTSQNTTLYGNLGLGAGTITTTGTASLGPIAANSVTTADDQGQRLVFGRWSVGDPTAYLSPSAGSSNGIIFQSANHLVNTLTINNTGNVSITGVLSIGNTVDSVTLTAPNKDLVISIGGVTYYIPAKTTEN